MYIYGITVENVKIMFVVNSMWAQSFCPLPLSRKHCLECICLMPLCYTLLCVQSWKVEVKRKCTCYQQLHSNENTATFTPSPPPLPLVYGPVAFTINMCQCQCLTLSPPPSLSLTHTHTHTQTQIQTDRQTETDRQTNTLNYPYIVCIRVCEHLLIANLNQL